MEIFINPERKTWGKLVKRPELEALNLQSLVQSVFEDIKINGDEAVSRYTKQYDQVDLDNFAVSEYQINKANELVSNDLKEAILLAKTNIENFHRSQKEEIQYIETTEGVNCWRESRPIEKVGIYIPGGSAPLFSTVLMLGIPAKLAGCKEIVLCTPPDKSGNINPHILYTASVVGIDKIYAVGGIQSIAAMTLGTETLPKVQKIFGPGNQYVTAAKQYAMNFGVAIDMPAGPSEVLIIADKTCNPEFVAADLLAQAEHGTDSQVILLSDNQNIIEKVIENIQIQLDELPRKNIAVKALENSKAIVFQNIDECLNFSNLYAPEHLILAIDNFQEMISKIENAGSVFLGNYSCESAGDYASGTNHTLPTNGYAANYSGVSLDSFVKKITFQELSAKGIQNIGPAIEKMASAEHLEAHKNAVTIRLKAI